MKRTVLVFVSILLLAMSVSSLFGQQMFEVNLNDRSDDTFKVTVHPAKLSAANNIFHFASTAPGTYQIMDIGRYIKNFKAFDASGKEIAVQNSSTNQWTISDPATVKKITYEAADIWESDIHENKPYPMCSSTISDNFVMINGQCVFGYFEGMQAEPMHIKIDYPAEWKIGTALSKNSKGYYEAEDFDHTVDSPFYLGDMTVASTEVGGATIDLYTHSINGKITSKDLLASMQDVLNAAADFTNGLPVDRYTFLFYFGAFNAGAWEHSYSSEYVMRKDSLTEQYGAQMSSIAAHEFFHVVTPLNIHSELIEQFNFVKPVMSQHLWLYEGVTEWAAHMMQYRKGLVSLENHLATVQGKLNVNDAFRQDLSLTELGVKSVEMQDQYGNIYSKGALIGELLDIRLLELSGDKKGLRELINELAKKYGKKQAFSEKDFFAELTKMTYPEVGDFIAKYIQGTEQLPVKEYFGWLGITYHEIAGYDSSRSALGISLTVQDGSIAVASVTPDSKSGLMKGDIITQVDGEALTLQTAQPVLWKLRGKKVGEKAKLIVKRDGKDTEVTAELGATPIRHKSEVMANATPEQLKLREVWSKNM
ncbi:MAG: PDZ domain-containing protein [Ignavibacteriae bacterium]|nr:PDZ domain-containing protein [Ignavibacteriota bacterium]